MNNRAAYQLRCPMCTDKNNTPLPLLSLIHKPGRITDHPQRQIMHAPDQRKANPQIPSAKHATAREQPQQHSPPNHTVIPPNRPYPRRSQNEDITK